MFQKMQSQQHQEGGIPAAVLQQQNIQPPQAHQPQETISLAIHHSHLQQQQQPETIPGGQADRLQAPGPPPQAPQAPQQPPAGPSQQIKSERLYKCNLCDKAYTQDHNLKHHIKSVHEGIVSNSNNALRHDGPLGHEYQHGMQRPKKEFFCNICNKLYVQRQGLKHHIRVWHEGIKSERLHKCSLCDKAYTQDHNLKHHMQSVHEGLRLFKCDSCDKDYTTRQGLKHHVKVVHLGYKAENLYKCQACEKAYTQKHNLTLHTKNVHGGVKVF